MKKVNGIWTKDKSDLNEVMNPGIPDQKPQFSGKNQDYLAPEYRGYYLQPNNNNRYSRAIVQMMYN